ncbi:MAG: hypothetical protein EBU82_09890 [Flavobacteriia bacterium]|nr:hypothetical protein [Flavobacteriia bacterium]
MTTESITQTNMATQRKFGPQWWVEGRKWGDLSTPTRLFPKEEDDTPDDWFEGIPRRSEVPPPPEPTWQEIFHDLHDLLTGSNTEHRQDVSFEQVASLRSAMNPPRPLPPAIVYPEPALSAYELSRQAELEQDKVDLDSLRQTYHENKKKLKELVAKQDELGNSLTQKEEAWQAECERQKKVYRPRHLPPLEFKKPVFPESRELEKLMDETTKLRSAMADYNSKVTKLKDKIAKGEEFMVAAFKYLEVHREYCKFQETLVGDYISY